MHAFIKCLQSALTKTTGVQHKPIRMNPKAIRAEEMFGETNKASGEWVDGVFAAMWSKFNDRNRKDMQVRVINKSGGRCVLSWLSLLMCGTVFT